MGNEGSRPSPLRRSKSSKNSNNQAITSGHQYIAEDEVDTRNNNDIILQQEKPLKRMDKIRRSLSFRKKKKDVNRKMLQSNTSHDIQTNNSDLPSNNIPMSMSVPGNMTKSDMVSSGSGAVSSDKPAGTILKPSNWIEDEKKVRAGSCSFQVKYLGSVEVSDSRGMHLCESAIEKLLAEKERKKPIKAILYVSGDSLRVVDESNKTLLVDQTIEKVSFCAPDRHHENGFAYICRDGTTRRWLCYCFMAIKDTLKGTSATGGSTSSGGERLSHAVGCAFSVCLEKKQKREKENVSMEVGPNHSFSRFGSFRQASLTERLEDPQMVMPGANNVPIKQVANPYAIERPKANPDVFTRQNSLRGTGALQLPFKRGSNAYTSLKPGELPSFQLQKANSGLNVNTNTMTTGNTVTKTSLLMQQHQINTLLSNNNNNNNNNNINQNTNNATSATLSSNSQNSFNFNEQNKIDTIRELPEETNNIINNSINLNTPSNQVPDKWASIFPTPQSIPVSPGQLQTSISPITPPPLPPMPATQTSVNISQYQKQQMFHQKNQVINQSMPARVNVTPLQQQFSLMSMTPSQMVTNQSTAPNPNETFEQKWARIQAAKKTNPFAEDIAKKYEIKLT